MKIKIGITLLLGLWMHISCMAQTANDTKEAYFYDTLTIMDYTTNAASERLTQLKKPIVRNFYLKSGEVSYHLFKGNVAKLKPEEVSQVINEGFSLFIDKAEHRGHKNLKPSVLEILDETGEVIESVDLQKIKTTALDSKLKIGDVFRLSGFIISVNEKKLGPILLDAQLVE